MTGSPHPSQGAGEVRGPEQKTLLRRTALARRKAIAPEIAFAFAARLAREAKAIVARHPNAIVSAFWPIGSEADTRPMLAALAAAGVATALPVTIARGKPLVFRLWQEGAPHVPGQMGILEPAPENAAVNPDILFVPLAAFDRRGHRIGYGAGHYDCTLARLRAEKSILAVGIAFATQEIAEVPQEAHDARLDFVLTEHELIDCRT